MSLLNGSQRPRDPRGSQTILLEMLVYFVKGEIRHLFDAGHSAPHDGIFNHTQTICELWWSICVYMYVFK